MDLLLHPAPNWFSPGALDVNEYGDIVAVATRNTVTFFAGSVSTTAGELSLLGGERITCVRFNRAPGLRHLLATGGSDGHVRVWDVESRREIRSLERLRKAKGVGGDPITAVDFPPAAPNLLVAATQGGALVTFALEESPPRRTSIHRVVSDEDHATCLASHPTALVTAVGSAQKGIILLDLCRLDAICRVEQDSGHVQALEWNRSGRMLLSSGPGSEITIWRFCGDKAHLERIRVIDWEAISGLAPAVERAWSAATWLGEDDVVATSFSHNLWRCFDVGGSSFDAPRALTTDGHQSAIFALRTLHDKERGNVIFSISMDRQIGEWRADLPPPVVPTWGLSSVGGHVKGLVVLPGAQMIAVCVGDGSVRILRRVLGGDSAMRRFQTTSTLSMRKVTATCVALLPPISDKDLVAVVVAGTKNGKLLYLEVALATGEIAGTTFSRDGHRSPVVGMEWSREAADRDGGWVRGCSWGVDGKAAEWTVGVGGPVAMSPTWLPSSRRVKCAEWSQDRRMLAWIDLKNQLSVSVRSSTASGPEATTVVAESVTAMSWSASEANVLAFGTQRGAVMVADVRAELVGSSSGVASFKVGQHRSRVTGLAWRPRSFDRADTGAHLLLTRSDDTTVGVVEVHDKFRSLSQPSAEVVRLRGHTGKLLTAVWLSGHEILSGGEDHTLRQWDMDRNPRPTQDVHQAQSTK